MVDLKDVRPGTKLLVVSNRVTGMNSHGRMDKWLGKVVTCDRVVHGTILLEEDRGDCPFQEDVGFRWKWSSKMFECIVDDLESDFEAPDINEMQFLLFG